MKKARLDGDRVDGDAPTTSIPACGHRRFDMCQVSASCTPQIRFPLSLSSPWSFKSQSHGVGRINGRHCFLLQIVDRSLQYSFFTHETA